MKYNIQNSEKVAHKCQSCDREWLADMFRDRCCHYLGYVNDDDGICPNCDEDDYDKIDLN